MGGTNNPNRRVKIDRVEAAVKALRDIGKEMNGDVMVPCLDLRDGGTCMRREGETVYGMGHTRRPYDKYRTERLCASCEAYWHVQRAADVLEHLGLITRKFGDPS